MIKIETLKQNKLPIAAAAGIALFLGSNVIASNDYKTVVEKKIDDYASTNLSKKEAEFLIDNLTYDAGVSFLYTPYIENIKLTTEKGGTFKIDSVTIEDTELTNLAFEINNLHVDTDGIPEDKLTLFKKETGAELEDIFINSTINHQCEDDSCNLAIKVDLDDMFEVETDLSFSGVKKYIKLLNDPETVSKLEENDMQLMQKILFYLSKSDSVNLSVSMVDDGMGTNSPLNKMAKEIVEIDSDVVVDSIKTNLNLDESDLKAEIELGTSHINGKAYINLEDISTDPQELMMQLMTYNVSISSFGIDLENDGADDIVWQFLEKNENVSREEIIKEIDKEITKFEDDDKYLKRESKSKRAKAIMRIVEEDNLIDAAHKIKDFIASPETASISFEPNKPMSLRRFIVLLQRNPNLDDFKIALNK